MCCGSHRNSQRNLSSLLTFLKEWAPDPCLSPLTVPENLGILIKCTNRYSYYIWKKNPEFLKIKVEMWPSNGNIFILCRWSILSYGESNSTFIKTGSCAVTFSWFDPISDTYRHTLHGLGSQMTSMPSLHHKDESCPTKHQLKAENVNYIN